MKKLKIVMASKDFDQLSYSVQKSEYDNGCKIYMINRYCPLFFLNKI